LARLRFGTAAGRVPKFSSGATYVANQVGKRYQCGKCGTEMIVTKGGQGDLSCCGQPMQIKQ
jgi:desulfoferrodoxin-like iron-binding protein